MITDSAYPSELQYKPSKIELDQKIIEAKAALLNDDGLLQSAIHRFYCMKQAQPCLTYDVMPHYGRSKAAFTGTVASFAKPLPIRSGQPRYSLSVIREDATPFGTDGRLLTVTGQNDSLIGKHGKTLERCPHVGHAATLEVGTADASVEQRVARDKNRRATLDNAELRVKEQAHASGRVTGRKNDLPSHVADLDDIAVINRLSRGTHVIVMAVGEDDGVELLLAKLLKCADDDVGIAGRIDHDGGCIVGDDVDVVLDGAHHHEVNGKATIFHFMQIHSDPF